MAGETVVATSTQPNQTISTKQVAPPTPAPSQTVSTPPATPKIETPQMTSSDILKRSSSEAPKTTDAIENKETSYREDLDKITDPSVKLIAEKALKDFESGYNKKYQTLAQQRKELEEMKNKISTWTPQRLMEEMKNPAFAQAAQILQQTAPPQDWTGSSEEWSSLNSQEKQQFQQMRNEQQSLQSQVAKMMQSQEDTEIKKVYPDYEPKVVDEAIEGLRSGSITASRADIWKVVNHDNNVEKGYQYGYEDGYKKALEKLNGNSILASNPSVAPADEVPEEVRKGGFSSIAMWRLSKSKNGQNKR